MKIVTKYQCDYCGETFYSEEECLRHEDTHVRVDKANKMLKEGKTLGEINSECNIWSKVPDYAVNITKDSCFTISYLQCCDKPAYRITYINMDGTLSVWGCGSWSGYYGVDYNIDNNYFRNPRPAEELFIDPRYAQRLKEGW